MLPFTSTVVICTRHRPDLLKRTLAAIRALRPQPTCVLVVDNSDGDEATRKVAEDNGARYLVEPMRGLSRARNSGISECQIDVVAFLDDDVIPEPDWLAQFLAPFSDPETGASSGNVITPDSPGNGDWDALRSVNRLNPRWVETAAFGGLGFGANMAFRRSALPERHFFDERLGRGAPLEIGEESYGFVWLLSGGYRSSTHHSRLFIIRHFAELSLSAKPGTPSPICFCSSPGFKPARRSDSIPFPTSSRQASRMASRLT